MQNSTIDFLNNANNGEISAIISNIEKDLLHEFALDHFTTGFEQEFYLSSSPLPEILDEISKIDGIFEVKKELGLNQFEVTTIPQVGFIASCKIIENFRIIAKEICKKHKIHSADWDRYLPELLEKLKNIYKFKIQDRTMVASQSGPGVCSL